MHITQDESSCIFVSKPFMKKSERKNCQREMFSQIKKCQKVV
jgi:hypothetical protein